MSIWGKCAVSVFFGVFVLSAIPAVAPEVKASGIIPVSAGTSVTVFEMTGWIDEYTYTVSNLMNGDAGSFSTCAMIEESYWVTSDGMYVTVHCYRDPPYYCSGYAVGNNIVAVRLNGVSGYPDGLWASVVVDYTLGVEGTAESVYNALGPDYELGPYANSPCTYLGDDNSELTVGFTGDAAVIAVTFDFDMDVFNIASKGNYVMGYVEMPEGYSPDSILLDSVLLNGVVPLASHVTEIGDYDLDGVPDIMMKFDREALAASLSVGTDVTIVITGTLEDWTSFSGTDVIDVINVPWKPGQVLSDALIGPFGGLSVVSVAAFTFASMVALVGVYAVNRREL